MAMPKLKWHGARDENIYIVSEVGFSHSSAPPPLRPNVVYAPNAKNVLADECR